MSAKKIFVLFFTMLIVSAKQSKRKEWNIESIWNWVFRSLLERCFLFVLFRLWHKCIFIYAIHSLISFTILLHFCLESSDVRNIEIKLFCRNKFDKKSLMNASKTHWGTIFETELSWNDQSKRWADDKRTDTFTARGNKK